jgi:hypothetical protein
MVRLEAGRAAVLAAPWRHIGPLILALLLGSHCACEKPRRHGLAGDRLQLEIQDVTLDAEVACDSLSKKVGLMDRESLPENAGMLFIYPSRERKKLSFWMHNTLIPLSIAFLDDDGTILQIEDMRPKDESSTWSMRDGRYALEVNQGWFQRHGIAVGDRFTDFQAKVRAFDAP